MSINIKNYLGYFMRCGKNKKISKFKKFDILLICWFMSIFSVAAACFLANNSNHFYNDFILFEFTFTLVCIVILQCYLHDSVSILNKIKYTVHIPSHNSIQSMATVVSLTISTYLYFCKCISITIVWMLYWGITYVDMSVSSHMLNLCEALLLS